MLQARYAYVRVSFTGLPHHEGAESVEVVVGVEVNRRVGGAVRALYEHVRLVLGPDIIQAITSFCTDDEIAEAAERVIVRTWPKRSYFIEVGRGDQCEWVQVFEPHGHNNSDEFNELAAKVERLNREVGRNLRPY